MTCEEQLIAYAKQGNPEAIAAILNYYFEPRQIAVKVGWQGNQLVVLCEALQLQKPEELMPVFEKALSNLKIQKFDCDVIQAVLYGRISGEAEPAWQVPLQIQTIPLTSSSHAIPDPAHKSSSDVSPVPILSQPCVSTNEKGSGDNRYGRFLCCGIGGSSQAIAQKLFIPVDSIDSVVQIFPSLILPVPYMPPSVLGIFQNRGQFVWIVDLLQPFDDPSHGEQRGSHRYITIMLNSQKQDSLIGFVVPHIEPQQVHSIEVNPTRPPQFQHLPDILVPFLSEVVTSDGSPILNPNSLFQDSHLQIHQGRH